MLKEVVQISRNELFATELVRSVDEVLASILGQSGRQALLSYVGGLSAVNNPEDFDHRLVVILGTGAEVLEKEIVKDLFLKLRIPFDPEENLDFVKSVKEAERRFEDAGVPEQQP